MDPAQLTTAAQQADAAVAAQTSDQALQAAIAQSRPDLWASLAANPSAYPDLLAWLSGTGNAAVLAALQERGYQPDELPAEAAGSDQAAGADAAQTVQAADAGAVPGGGEASLAAQQADAAVAAQTSDQALQAAIAQSRPDLWASLAANPSAYPDLLAWLSGTGDATVLAILQARGYSPDVAVASAASGATAAEPADETTDEAASVTVDAPDVEASTDEPSPEDEGEKSDDAENPEDLDDADEPSDEPEEDAPQPDESEKAEESEDLSARDAQNPVADTEETEDTEDIGDPEDAGDAEQDTEESPGDSDEADPSGDEPVDTESPDEHEDSDTPADADSDAEGQTGADDAATDADDEDSDERREDSEGESEADIDDGPEDSTESASGPETEESAEDQAAGAASSGEETASSGEEPAGQTESIPAVETTAVFAAAGATEVMASAQSAAPAAGSAESVAMPVAPPPSAEDIAAWAETPSGAPSGFSAAQPAVELDMFGPQMSAQMPPSQQQKQASGSSTGRLVAVIVVLLLVIVGGGGVWAGSYFSGKGDSSRDNAGDQSGKQDPGQANAAATVTASALPSGAVKACSSMPALTITSVQDGQGELTVQANVTTSCADGDFLAGSSNQILVYSSTSPTGGADVDHLVASGTFDLSSEPLIIPNGGRTVVLRFGEQHYFRTAKDLDLKSLKVTPTFDRGSQSSVTSSSSTNSPMTIATSTSSSAGQEQQEEQAAGQALRWQADHDRSLVMGKFLGKWTPQLSSKQVGLYFDGQTWSNRSILAEFLKTRQANPNTVIVNSSDWSVFDVGGWWVTLSGELYATADEANAWCDAQGYDSDHCLAKRMESSGSPQGTTKSR